ncbi:MAG: PqqD family protein [Candidatus Omnitrophica bacterium]|nr:PqqD family protein [Candidatus Omnitrophota bacterium]
MTAKINLEHRYTPSENVVTRDIQGEFIMIPIAAGVGDLEDDIFSLNKFGRAIWEELDGKKTLKDVARALGEKFEGDPATIEKDVLGLTEELLKRKMISKTS